MSLSQVFFCFVLLLFVPFLFLLFPSFFPGSCPFPKSVVFSKRLSINTAQTNPADPNLGEHGLVHRHPSLDAGLAAGCLCKDSLCAYEDACAKFWCLVQHSFLCTSFVSRVSSGKAMQKPQAPRRSKGKGQESCLSQRKRQHGSEDVWGDVLGSQPKRVITLQRRSRPPRTSVFSSLGLPVLDLVLRTFTCSTDSACSFETSVFSVNHLARIFAHAACRTQRCFKTASDASRCFHFSRFATPPCACACRILRILPGLSLYTSCLCIHSFTDPSHATTASFRSPAPQVNMIHPWALSAEVSKEHPQRNKTHTHTHTHGTGCLITRLG